MIKLNESNKSTVNKQFELNAFDQNLASAIWFKEIVGKYRMASALQFEILQKAGGLSGLWSLELHDNLIDYKNKDGSVKFADEKIYELKRDWKNVEKRNSAAQRSDSVKNLNIHAVDITCTDYPFRLKAISSRPNILFYRGNDLGSLNKIPFCVTVIGTRTPTPYGRLVTENFSEHLAAYNTAVISGLARGIDTIVHRTVMDKGGMTVAVLGCGPDVAYPPENEKLQRKVAEHGLLITEHPPGIKPLRHYFPARNRILSGLSDAVIITESANKSGTLITAGFAADQGRDVYAVPGSILSNSSAGCHSLIKDGAILIESADEALTGRNCELRNLHSNPINENIKISEITVEAKIIQALLSMSLSLDQLTEETAESVESLSAVLTILELNGKVTCHRGRYFLTDTSSCCI